MTTAILHKTFKLVISRCCLAEDCKRNVPKCITHVQSHSVLLIKTYCFVVKFSLPSWLLKVPGSILTIKPTQAKRLLLTVKQTKRSWMPFFDGILGLQPRDKAAMLVVNTKEIFLLNLHQNRVHFPAERNAFVLDHQHGRRDVTCKPAIHLSIYLSIFFFDALPSVNGWRWKISAGWRSKYLTIDG